MNKFTITKDTRIILDGKLYLLEEGDEIIVESLRESEKAKLAEKLGITEITSVDNFWETKSRVDKYLRKKIAEANRVKKELNREQSAKIDKRIEDVRELLDSIDDFLRSFASREVDEKINDDLIRRHEMTDEQLEAAKVKGDIEDTLRSHRAQEKEKLKRAFGETPEEAVKRMKQEREKESKLFESVYNLLSI